MGTLRDFDLADYNCDVYVETGTGVFVRENGVARELTIEEVVKFRNEKGVEPIRAITPNYQKMWDRIHRLSFEKLEKFKKELELQHPSDEYLPGVSVYDCLTAVEDELEKR